MDNNQIQGNTNEISLKEIVFKIREWTQYLISKWYILFVAGLIGGTAGFFYAKSKKPIYTATTTFVLEGGESGGGLGGSLGGLASIAGIDLDGGGGDIFQGDNILQLYKSHSMIKKTLFTSVDNGTQSELLINFYIDFNKLREDWAKSSVLKDIKFDNSTLVKGKFTRIQDSIIGTIVSDINKNYLTVAKPDKKLSIIQADVKAGDEVFAKTFNEAIVKNVNDFYVQTKTKRSLDNIAILQQKTDSVRAVMNGAISSAVIAIDNTPNLNPTKQAQRLVPSQRSQFSAETNKAILGTLVQNLEMSKMALLKEAPLIQVIDEPIYPLKMVVFGKVKGVIFGGFLSIFSISIVILIRKIFQNIIS